MNILCRKTIMLLLLCTFITGIAYSQESKSYPKLISWTEADNPAIRYFSGTGTYQKEFQNNADDKPVKNERTYLELGNLSKIAEVWLNGKPIGIT